jgi:hypothetical protein
MAILKRVNVTPAKLEKNEMVILKPNFQEEIDAVRGRKGISKLTTSSYLSSLFMAITDKYAPDINPYTLKLSKYVGLKAESDDDIRNVLLKVIEDRGLPLLEKVIEFQIRNRTPKIDTIYYVSNDSTGLNTFTRFGFNEQQIEKKNKVKEQNVV